MFGRKMAALEEKNRQLQRDLLDREYWALKKEKSALEAEREGLSRERELLQEENKALREKLAEMDQLSRSFENLLRYDGSRQEEGNGDHS